MKEKDGEFKVHNECLQSFVFYYVQCELAYNDPPPIVCGVPYNYCQLQTLLSSI